MRPTGKLKLNIYIALDKAHSAKPITHYYNYLYYLHLHRWQTGNIITIIIV